MKHGVDEEELQKKSPTRIFHVFVEEWEEAARHEKKLDCETMLLGKYGGIRFSDPADGTVLEVYDKECYWQSKKKKDPIGETWGYHVHCFDPEKDPEGGGGYGAIRHGDRT